MSTMKTVLCYSGGLDSTVLLYHLRELGHDVYCLSADYGQRHYREVEAARGFALNLGLEYKLLDLCDIGQSIMTGSSQTGDGKGYNIPVPEGHYEEESMKATVVPNRNMVLLSLATAWAVSLKADYVAYAAHAGDHAVYPDCRPAFFNHLGDAIRLCDWHKVEPLSPFIRMTKAQIVKEGDRLGVPFEKTYSCYKGRAKHCGKCGTCCERLEAFQLAGVPDPTDYEA